MFAFQVWKHPGTEWPRLLHSATFSVTWFFVKIVSSGKFVAKDGSHGCRHVQIQRCRQLFHVSVTFGLRKIFEEGPPVIAKKEVSGLLCAVFWTVC